VPVFAAIFGQITINCGERGLLLLRVRDDIRMTIAAYQTLYESSIAFGMRKALMAEQRKRNMEARIRELEQQCEDHEQQVKNLQDKCKSTEEYEAKKRAEEEEKHQEQVEFFKNQNEKLKQNLESLLSVPSKK
jgi:dynein light intermediate chain